MRKSRVALLGAFVLLLTAAVHPAAAQRLLCEQPDPCCTYPGGSIGDGGDGTGTGDGTAPQFNVNEQFASVGGDSFVGSDASMIGDLIGPRVRIGGATVVTAGSTTRFKLADNQSPMPRDRIFYNYSHFHNSVDDAATGTAFDINRHVFGLENTFLDGLVSAEFRIPFANTTSAEQDLANGSFVSGTEFGDIAVAGKVLLINSPGVAVSAGIVTTLPTADDVVITNNGLNPITLENESFRGGPFIGVIVRPTGRFVVQGVVQTDLVWNGSAFSDPGTNSFGEFQDHNLIMFDVSAAYWFRQNQNQMLVSGIAGIFEVHYTTSSTDGDAVFTGGGMYGDRHTAPIATEAVNVDILSLTGGVELRFGPQNSLVIGAGVPVRRANAGDQLFDTEVLVHWNRFY